MGKKILIVDPDIGFVDMLSPALEKGGYDVEVVYEGDEGLKKARKLMPDLLLLDIVLPVLDGFKLSRLLKFDKKRSKVKVVFITADDTEGENKKIAKEVGAEAILSKGDDLSTIVDFLKTLSG